MKPLLEVIGVTKHFGRLLVLDNLSLSVKKGEFVSVIGPSGCGKTTLLKILGGLTEPIEGEVRIRGGSVRDAMERREFGFVFQNPVLLPWRNTIENINLPAEISSHKESHELTKRLIKIVGLEDFEGSYPRELSGGMQQRVAIARALLFEPSILLMDEPFGSLDEINRNRMNLELLEIWKGKKKAVSTVVFVTHSISEAVFLSDRVIVLSPRPARIERIIEIDLPRPRKTETRHSKRYRDLIECIRKALREQ